MLDTLRTLYEKIPTKLRKPIVHWVFPFIVGLIITLIWDVGTLLAVLVVLFAIFFLIGKLGSRRAQVASEWSIKQYFKRIRGMIIFALLPAAWELIREFSSESILALCVLIFVGLSIWERFDKIIKNTSRQLFGKRRRRR